MAEVKNITLEALERNCASGETGRLDFRRGDYEGQIYVDNKRITHAQLAGIEGIPALFRLFDWGDAETTWQSGVKPEHSSLNITMDEASTLYAENLRDRAELEARDQELVDQSLILPESVAGQTGGIESILKNYTISLECTTPGLLPDGFTFVDSSKSSYVIGSSTEADVVLNHPSIDPLHCGMILENGRVLVWDLGAPSGIKLNGRKIEEDTLKVGDVLRLGELDLRVQFKIRRPTIKPKPVGPPDANTISLPSAHGPATRTGTLPSPMPGPPPKEMPKGPITYDKVAKQLKGRTAGVPFLEKLSSLFGPKKK
jgi:pSer/pThr/pTyr-binding forkhead associated (FHA) protein